MVAELRTILNYSPFSSIVVHSRNLLFIVLSPVSLLCCEEINDGIEGRREEYEATGGLKHIISRFTEKNMSKNFFCFKKCQRCYAREKSDNDVMLFIN